MTTPDSMHFMHRMHLTEQKRVSAGFVMNLVGYNREFLKGDLIWEQEVPSSNLGAPTNDFKHLERVLVEPVLFCLFSRRWDRRYSLRSVQLIL